MTVLRDHKSTLGTLIKGQGLNIPDSQIYEGPLHENMPDTCITMIPEAGSAPSGFIGEDVTEQNPDIQLRIRVPSEDYSAGQSDALDIYGYVHQQTPAGYVWSKLTASQPAYFQDDDGRHNWTWTANFKIIE